jgi:hypothetical protein
MKKNLEKHVKLWHWAGRILPLSALVILAVELAFDLDSVIDYTLCAIGVIFAMFAFTWWWWILDTVRKLFVMLQTAQDRFTEVIEELNEIKSEVKNNDSNRKRSKPKKNQS